MNALELRRRTLGKSVYKKTVEGNPAIAQGSLARMYPGITMQGWTEQAQYEGNQLFDKSGLELDYTLQYIHVNVGDGEFTLSTDYIVTGRKDIFFLSGNVNSGASSANNGVELGNNRTITSENGYVTVVLRRNSDGVNNPLDYHIMLNEGSTALPWEPYTGGNPSPSPDYPQPIISAGKYDEASRKYQYTIKISDSEESPTKSQTVTLTSERPLTKWDKLEKRNGQWGWVYKSAEIVLDGSEDEIWLEYASNDGYYIAVITSVYNDFRVERYAFSDKFLFVNDFSYEHPSIISPSKYYHFLNVKRYGETLSDWRTYLQTNPVTILYETELEAFVPLSETEQEQMNALHTFHPTTVLSNDAGCEMALTYKTKKSLEVTD